MDYTVAYDVSNESMKYFWLLSIPFALFIGGIMTFHIKNKSKDLITKVVKLSFMLLFVLGWGWIVGTGEISGYQEVRRILAQEEYQTVEGIIENFDPMPSGGHKHESFTVNEVKFEYSDFNEAFYGFNNTKSHGGPITGNGQKVKIEYYNRKGKNYIFKLMIKE